MSSLRPLFAVLILLVACTTPEKEPEVATSPPGLPDLGAVAEALEKGPVPGGAGVWLRGSRHGSLRAALLAAKDGDRIELESGVHAGPIEIMKSVDLAPHSAEGQAVIDSRSPLAVRVRGGARVSLRHLEIRASGNHRSDAEAAVVVQGAVLEIVSCTINSRRSGALSVLSATVDIDASTIVSEAWQSAVMIGNESVAELRDCRVEARAERSSGLEVWGAHCVMKLGEIRAGTAALVAGQGSEVSAVGVRLRGAGAACLPGGWMEMQTCDVRDVEKGVVVRGVVGLVANRFQGNQVAVMVAGTDARLTVSGNVSTANVAWLGLIEGAELRQITDLDLTEEEPAEAGDQGRREG